MDATLGIQGQLPLQMFYWHPPRRSRLCPATDCSANDASARRDTGENAGQYRCRRRPRVHPHLGYRREGEAHPEQSRGDDCPMHRSWSTDRAGDSCSGQILTGEESARAGRLLAGKYPILHGLLVPLGHWLRGNTTTHIELTQSTAWEAVAADGGYVRFSRTPSPLSSNPGSPVTMRKP